MLVGKLRLPECSHYGDRRNDREWPERLTHLKFREITWSDVMVDRLETITLLLSEKTASPIVSSDFRLTEIARD
ncbi:hypothetical protein [uncultured Pantoea sp.]|uniref:hypothetical protein n=1 Tax=uncultured Pantoea sp. TaxID=218084 RepID=UPI002588EFAE|nr:hypothetical protein [uncultured Pantoea sp.]